MGVYAGPTQSWGYSNLSNNARFFSSTKLVVQSGLVMNLDAGVSSSYPGIGTTWTDLSGNGNNVIIYNGPSFANGEFTLDADAYFGVSNNFMGTTNASNVSYNFFMKFNWGTPVGYKTIFGFQQSNFDRVANFVLNTGDNKLEFDLRNAGTVEREIFNYNMSSYANQTSLITYTFDSGVHKLYINGSNVSTYNGTQTTFPSWSTGSGGFCVGNNLASTRYLGEGTFSHMLVYLKTLTPQEIQQNYNALKSRFQ